MKRSTGLVLLLGQLLVEIVFALRFRTFSRKKLLRVIAILAGSVISRPASCFMAVGAKFFFNPRIFLAALLDP